MAVIVRKRNENAELSDAQMYHILRAYRLGNTPETIAADLGLSVDKIQGIIYNEITGLNTMKASMQLIYSPFSVPNKTETMNEKFLALVPDAADIYAYYYAMTGSNEYALKEAGLDVGLEAGPMTGTKRYALSVRGQYLRKIPSVKKYIETIQQERLRDANVEKNQVQSELLKQIEEMKELAGDDPRYRGHLLKAIEMLGKTIGAFQDNLKIEDASTKSGLELLMEKAKGEVYELAGEEHDDQQD